MQQYLILSFGYQEYAIQLTPEVSDALAEILSAEKVQHRSGNLYTRDSTKSELSFRIAEVIDGDN